MRLVLLQFCSLALLVAFPVRVRAEQTEISLNGDSWFVSDASGARVSHLQATVPGQVHLDLLRHGVIGDPYFGFNDTAEEWVAYSNWVYSRSFQLTGEEIEGKTVWLKCDGLDTFANVSVNGRVVGTAENMHRRYFFDLTGIAKVGENMIEILFESAANKSVEIATNYPYYVDPGAFYFQDAMRNYARKTQSDFGWDWGPAFVPCGIWQNISVVMFESAYVSYVVPKAYFGPDNEGKLPCYSSVLVCVTVPQTPTTPLTVSVKHSIPGTPFEAPIQMVETLSGAGETCLNLTSEGVDASKIDPYLWWPYARTHKFPNLYSAVTNISVSSGGETISNVQVSKKIGFRSIRLIQEPPPDGKAGLTFYFSIDTSDGTFPIYAKGSNFIPMDAFLGRVTYDYGKRLMTSVIQSNQNMIRIWGGGLYQVDWLYELCDELGIMVWQEFMFACAMYPRDKTFLENVQEEIRHQVRRLGHHPSIVMWSGNNENQDEGTRTSGNLVDYTALYDDTVRATLWEEDNTRPYWPASPSNGVLVDDKHRGLFIQRWGLSSNTSYGDVHRYDYTDLCTDVTKFPRPRFASEFGFQSYPSFNAIATVSEPKDWSNNSTFMNHRQHHPNGNQELADMMQKLFHLPNNPSEVEEFMDFVYLTQVVQAVCIKAEAEHYRRLLSESGAYTRGTLYWQLNDIWQAQSWSSIEYSGRWKLLHYIIRKVYATVLVSAYKLSGDIGVYVVVDEVDVSISYSLEVQVISWKGDIVDTFKKDGLKSSGFTGVQVWIESVEKIFASTSTTQSFLYILIRDSESGEILADNHFFPTSFAQAQLVPATNPVNATGFKQIDPYTVNFTISASVVAPFVYLDSMSIDGNFNDNSFLLMPMVKQNITFSSWERVDATILSNKLRIRTVQDTYK